MRANQERSNYRSFRQNRQESDNIPLDNLNPNPTEQSPPIHLIPRAGGYSAYGSDIERENTPTSFVRRFLPYDEPPNFSRPLNASSQGRPRPSANDTLFEEIELVEPGNSSGGNESEQQILKISFQKVTEGTTKFLDYAKIPLKSFAEFLKYSEKQRNIVGKAFKENDNSTDQTEYLAKPPSGNIQKIYQQNLSTNAEAESIWNYPDGQPANFGDEAAVIGMTRNSTRAVSGITVFDIFLKKLVDNIKKAKIAKKAKNRDDLIDSIVAILESIGILFSAVTYTGISITEAREGDKHHSSTNPSNAFSGAVAAANNGGQIMGTSIPFNIGKVISSTTSFASKFIDYGYKGIKACSKGEFKDYDTLIQGAKNSGELVKSGAGAVKDWANLMREFITSKAAYDTQVVTAGAVVPASVAELGLIDFFEGLVAIVVSINKLSSAYNKRNTFKSNSGNLESGIAREHTDPKKRHEILDKAIDMRWNNFGLAMFQSLLGIFQLLAFLMGSGYLSKFGGEKGLSAASVYGGALVITRGWHEYLKDKKNDFKEVEKSLEDLEKELKRIEESSNESSQHTTPPEVQMRLDAIQDKNRYVEDVEAEQGEIGIAM